MRLIRMLASIVYVHVDWNSLAEDLIQLQNIKSDESIKDNVKSTGGHIAPFCL